MKIVLPRKLIPPPKEKIVLPKIAEIPTSNAEYFADKKVARLLKALDSGKTISTTAVVEAFDKWLQPLADSGALLRQATEKYLAQNADVATNYKKLLLRVEHMEDSVNMAEEAGKTVSKSQLDRLSSLRTDLEALLPERFRTLEARYKRRFARLIAVRKILLDKVEVNRKGALDKKFDKMRKKLSNLSAKP